MAAIEPQAKKSQQYLKRHMNRPFLREYVTARNERSVEITRYLSQTTGISLTKGQYDALAVAEQTSYREIKNYVQIIICTLQGANSEHVPVMVVDEVDVVENADAYEEAKMIPAPINGMMPVTLYTSTRKYSFGLVQKEIDKASKTNLVIRHWNLIDVTHNCPPNRHQPELPKVMVYTSTDVATGNLTTITEDDYKLLDAGEKSRYHGEVAYQGCVKNCSIYAACRGKLAEKPLCKNCKNDGTPCASFLKPVAHTQNQFTKVTLEKAKAQLLCWKPSAEGLIFPNFSRDLHMKTAAEMAEIITGESVNPSYTKADLIRLLKERGARFVAGADHGFSHNYALVMGAVIGNRLFIIDVFSQAELELPQKIEFSKQRIDAIAPDMDIWADTAQPADNKTMRRYGLRIKDWTKDKGSVVDGISLIRLKLLPAFGKPDDAQLFLLKGDNGCELLATRLTGYHWTTDAAGNITNVPDEEDDDEIDALRYLVLNNFSPKTRANISIAAADPMVKFAPGERQYSPDKWMEQVIEDATGVKPGEVIEKSPGAGGKKGSFSWSL